ncbi:MAG TPA: TIGR00270 family protein [Candidatus Poseidoniaceae archaeon]|nr:TIGR00270 family protein [Candidatus Poseidoniaceae archaeon]
MGECEICGAMNVGVRLVLMGKTNVYACQRCVEKLGLASNKVAPGIKQSLTRQVKTTKSRRKNDIMAKQEKELVDDFASKIAAARQSKGWNQSELGKRMAETVNVIKSAESGKPPTDSVVKKFERVLGISLMDYTTPTETSRLTKGSNRGMTLGDFFNQNGD